MTVTSSGFPPRPTIRSSRLSADPNFCSRTQRLREELLHTSDETAVTFGLPVAVIIDRKHDDEYRKARATTNPTRPARTSRRRRIRSRASWMSQRSPILRRVGRLHRPATSDRKSATTTRSATVDDAARTDQHATITGAHEQDQRRNRNAVACQGHEQPRPCCDRREPDGNLRPYQWHDVASRRRHHALGRNALGRNALGRD